MTFPGTFPITNFQAVAPAVTYPLTKCFDLGGTDEYIDTNVTTNFSASDFSISLWLKGSSAANMSYAISRAKTISSFASNWIIPFNTGSTSLFWMRSITVTTGAIADSAWHHLVFVYDQTAGTYEGFTDGSSVGTSGSVTGTGAEGTIKIGTRGDATTQFATVKVTEVLIYNSKLTSGNVTSLYNSGTPTTPVGSPVHHWSMNHPSDDATGTTGNIVDTGSGATDGTPFNTEVGDLVTDAP